MTAPSEALLAALQSSNTGLLDERAEFVSMVKMQQLVRVTCLEVMQGAPSQIEAYRKEVAELQELVKGYLHEVRESRGAQSQTPSSPSTASLHSSSVPHSPGPLTMLEATFEEAPQEQWYEHKPLPRFAVRVRQANGDDYPYDDVVLSVSMLNGRGQPEEQKANGSGELLSGERTAVVRNGLAEWTALRIGEPSSKHYGAFTMIVHCHTAPEGVGVEELRSSPLTVQVGRMWSKRRKAESELSADDPITQIPGVGARYVARLQLHGLATIGQFATMASTPAGRDALCKLCKGDNPRNSLNQAKLQAMIDAANKVCGVDTTVAHAKRARGGDAAGLTITAAEASGSSALPDEPEFTMEELLLLTSPDGSDFSELPPTPSLTPLTADGGAFSFATDDAMDDTEPVMRRMQMVGIEGAISSSATAESHIAILPPKMPPTANNRERIDILPPKQPVAGGGALSGFAALDALGGISTDADALPTTRALVPAPAALARAMRAAWAGDAASAGAADGVDRFGCTPAHVAALAGHSGHVIADLLALPSVASCLDAPAAPMGGATPLHLAACRGPAGEAAALALLDAGATPNAVLQGQVSAVHLAAWSGAHTLLSTLVDVDASLIDHASDAGLTALEYAALGGHAVCVSLLVQRGAAGGATLPPLHCAALGDDDECLALLLQATPEGVGVHSAAGWLPLHAAAASDSLTAVRALLAAGGDIDGVTSDGHTTALELACGCGHADVAALLVENGASVGASDGCPPALLCAGASGEIECIQVLAGLTSAERVDEMASIVEQLHLE